MVKKKMVHIKVSLAVHKRLKHMAIEEGKHIGELATNLLEGALDEEIKFLKYVEEQKKQK